MDQPGKVANPARSWSAEQGEKVNSSLSAFAPENLASRDGFGSPVPRQPAHLHTQAMLCLHTGFLPISPYLRDFSLLTGFLPISATASIFLFKPQYAIGLVSNLSGHHAIIYCVPMAFTTERPPAQRASKPQGSSERMLPWQVTMDQLICASLSHTHY